MLEYFVHLDAKRSTRDDLVLVTRKCPTIFLPANKSKRTIYRRTGARRRPCPS